MIDPEEYGTFKGRITERVARVEDDVKRIFKAVKEAKDEMIKVVKDHMDEEEAYNEKQLVVDAAQAEAIKQAVLEIQELKKVLSESIPAIEFLKKVIVIMDFLKIFTWKNIFGFITFLAFVFGVLVPLSQDFFAPDSIPGKIIDALTYGPNLIEKFT